MIRPLVASTHTTASTWPRSATTRLAWLIAVTRHLAGAPHS